MSQRVTTILTTTTVRKQTRTSASPNLSASKRQTLTKTASTPKFYEYFCRGMYRMRQAALQPKPSVRKSIDSSRKR